MKLLRWSILPVALACAVLPALRTVALPVEPDYPCYLRTASGRVVDLTPSMCAAEQSKSTVPTLSASVSTRPDSLFIQEYKKRAALVSNRAAAKMLLAEVSQTPDAKESEGAEVCRILAGVEREGGLIEETEMALRTRKEKTLPTEAQDALKYATGMADIAILIQLYKEGVCQKLSTSTAYDSSSSSSGICNTPYDRMRNGRLCGGNAASERPGGR